MIYVDSCILIYALEDLGARGDLSRHVLATASESLAISPLVVHEVLVGPLRDRSAERVARVQGAVDSFEMLDLGLEEFLDAASLRAHRRGLRTADALHLAAARSAKCSAVWTNDSRLSAASEGLAVDVLAAG